jgi:GntR family transcriptional regulator
VIPVKQAWEELKRDGFIHTMAGKGCFVSPLKPADLKSRRDALAVNKLKKDTAYYKGLGLWLEMLIDFIRRNSNQ